MFDVEKIKEDFPIFENHRKKYGKELVYLDSAASSQTPKSVVEAMDDYYLKYRSNVHRSPYDLGEAATDAYERARSKVAGFIGAKSKEIIFTPGATLGANMLAYMLGDYLKLGKGDEILASISEHHSNFVPFQELAHRTGAGFKTIPLKRAELDYEMAEKLISNKTKIITLPLASNVLGTIYDVGRLAKKAKSSGAAVIVDATKAVGHMEIDTRALGADFLFFSGHKMLGPTGIGVLWGKKEILGKLTPGFFGGGMVNAVGELETSYRETPLKFEAGTPNVSGAVGLASAIEYLENVGIKNIREHSEKLVAYANERLTEIPGLKILSEKDPKKNIGIVSFNIDGIHPHDAAEILGSEGIAIRGGHHCAMPLMKHLGVSGVCRASFYIYNDEKDIDRLAEGIKKVQKTFA